MENYWEQVPISKLVIIDHAYSGQTEECRSLMTIGRVHVLLPVKTWMTVYCFRVKTNDKGIASGLRYNMCKAIKLRTTSLKL